MRNKKIGYDLIVSAVSGDMAAAGIIVESYTEYILYVIEKRACWLDRDTKVECCQEVKYRLMRIICSSSFR